MVKAQALFFNALTDVSFHAEVGLESSTELAAKFVIKDAGQTEAGWKLRPEVLNKIDRELTRKRTCSVPNLCDRLQLVTAHINREFSENAYWIVS